VADGVGGHSHGEVASSIVKTTIRGAVAHGEDLLEAICSAHSAVLEEIARRKASSGMGSTVVAMTLEGESYDIVWVGDSRAYLWDGEKLSQLSRDHRHVSSLVAQGLITREEAKNHPERNLLTQSIGVSANTQIHPDRERGVIKPGQQIILCSDGLSDELSDEEIATQMCDHDSAQGQVDGLMQAALTAGGSDNITVIVVGSPPPGANP